ncbi:MAG: FAD-dependent oxidoreductase [Alphaproteobacteria bacterium]|nr:FAD-dependent oxidoreductase [Alphaproteobacteria bacterium]
MPARLHRLPGTDSVEEAARMLPVARRTEVLVLGGGVAGLSAALAAAKLGAEVLLIERGNCLGGTATAGMMALFYTPYRCAHSTPKEIFDRLIAEGGAFPGEVISVDHEAFKTVALEMATERNVRLLFHTTCADVVMDGNRLRGIVIEGKDGRQAVLADVVIDASGDGDIAARAGAPMSKGRDSDSKMRPMTLLFRMGGVDVGAMLEYVRGNPEEFSKDPNQMLLDVAGKNIRIFGFFGLVQRAKQQGYLYDDCHYFRVESVFPERGSLLVNTIRIYGVDGTQAEDVTRAEIEGRRQQKLLLRFARDFLPGFATAYILDSASHIGVRETRRIIGDYVLTEEDIVDGARFPDTIGVDSNRQNPKGFRHSPDGKEGSAEDIETREWVADLFTYEIPYRCLIPQRIDGLIVAGRAISSNHAADGYTRNQPACMVTGQAAGAAAALCARLDVEPRALDVATLQAALRQLDAKLRADELRVDELRA